MIAATRSEVSVAGSALYVAFELGKRDWKLAMTSGFGVRAVVRTIVAGDWRRVDAVLEEGRQRLGLVRDVPVLSCYEAGRDGFWIHRALTRRGVRNRVVDSASIEVNRRARRTKTDRLDAIKLVAMLVRVALGEARVWREVRVPDPATEAARQVSREREALLAERTRLVNQMRSLLATQGAAWPRRASAEWWTTVRTWEEAPLPPTVQARLARADARLQLIAAQLATLDDEQTATIRRSPEASAAARLVQLKGIAVTSASILLDEGLVWRQFANRRQLGGILGFAPTPHQSGALARDQGISRAGNARLQSVMVQLAWGWLRFQPTSGLATWYRERFGAGQRARKIGIVALARKLLIALWRWATTGMLPAGAVLKTA